MKECHVCGKVHGIPYPLCVRDPLYVREEQFKDYARRSEDDIKRELYT